MQSLTERQQEILDFIGGCIARDGIPPTVAEIASAMGLSSGNGVRGHLQALARKGAIELIPNASRGIRLLESTEAEQGLPIVGRVAAGSPVLAQEHIEDYCPIGAGFFHPGADFLLRVSGESMRDAGILDGDLLAVKRTPDAENGQIVVARLDNEVTVKRLQKRGRTVYLHAENPDFSPIVVDLKNEAFAIEGIAVGVLRSF